MGAQLKSETQDQTLVLTLSNPGAKNALHPDMYAAGIEALSTAERDPDVRAVVLTGAGDVFCAGGNLHRLLENRAKPPSVQAESIDQLHSWIEAIRDCNKPVIAAVEGAAAGAGFSLALACDLIVAAQSAKFVMAYVKVGLSPDGGASWFLSQALPRQLATEMLIEGQATSSERLHQYGLVNRVVTDGEALSAALSWGDALATLSPHAIGNIKSLLCEAPSNSLSSHLQTEKQRFVESLHHRDGLEGITAFLEKRKPHYR